MSNKETLEWVKNSGTDLQYVKEQTPEICMAAIKQSEWALKYVKEQTSELCMTAVQQMGTALQLVKDRSMLEIKQN